MSWILNLIPWWAYVVAGLALVFAVERLFGWKAAFAALAGVVGIVLYRKGSDDARKRVTDELARRQQKSKELVSEEEQGALAAGRAAADRVRQRAAGATDGGDKKPG